MPGVPAVTTTKLPLNRTPVPPEPGLAWKPTAVAVWTAYIVLVLVTPAVVYTS